MNIFIIGVVESYREVIAQDLSDDDRFYHISISNWLENSFRSRRTNERKEDYEQEYLDYYLSRVKLDSEFCSNFIFDTQKAIKKDNCIITGIMNPADFTSSFSTNKDVVVFLNRQDSDPPSSHDGVAINVIRDYCLYLALLGRLPRERYIEYNYKVSGEESDHVKQTGKYNSVFIVKSFKKLINHLRDEICNLLNQEKSESSS